MRSPSRPPNAVHNNTNRQCQVHTALARRLASCRPGSSPSSLPIAFKCLNSTDQFNCTFAHFHSACARGQSSLWSSPPPRLRRPVVGSARWPPPERRAANERAHFYFQPRGMAQQSVAQSETENNLLPAPLWDFRAREPRGRQRGGASSCSARTRRRRARAALARRGSPSNERQRQSVASDKTVGRLTTTRQDKTQATVGHSTRSPGGRAQRRQWLSVLKTEEMAAGCSVSPVSLKRNERSAARGKK